MKSELQTNEGAPRVDAHLQRRQEYLCAGVGVCHHRQDRGRLIRKINDAGGINGRKITLISYDDAYSPPTAVEQARRLVENDEVLLIFNSLGTPSNSAIQKYGPAGDFAGGTARKSVPPADSSV